MGVARRQSIHVNPQKIPRPGEKSAAKLVETSLQMLH